MNLGELAGAAIHSNAAAMAGAVILLAMATKAAVVPLHGWLPRTYPQVSAVETTYGTGRLDRLGGLARSNPLLALPSWWRRSPWPGCRRCPVSSPS